jgi:hypothetical protein
MQQEATRRAEKRFVMLIDSDYRIVAKQRVPAPIFAELVDGNRLERDVELAARALDGTNSATVIADSVALRMTRVTGSRDSLMALLFQEVRVREHDRVRKE